MADRPQEPYNTSIIPTTPFPPKVKCGRFSERNKHLKSKVNERRRTHHQILIPPKFQISTSLFNRLLAFRSWTSIEYKETRENQILYWSERKLIKKRVVAIKY
jgi:hypothetical protein